MKAAIVVPQIEEYNITANLKIMLTYIDEAINANADLLLFPETVLTGLVISDDYDVDKQYAISLASEYINQIREKARRGDIWIAFGFLEIDEGILYDSALLIDSAGDIALHQRRLSPGWCATNARPEEYGYGSVYASANTPWGKVGFMICGDLFNVPHYAADEKLDILLFPFARCFGPWVTLPYQQEWDEIEWPEYAKQIASVGAVYTLGANYIAPEEGSAFNGGFGGGFITDRAGRLLAGLPLFRAGLLLHDLECLS
ncbi:MAG: carbon-nitrogen hydrolase family protein [Defluviitaleaceae bacterium]|nr:carbon-nitrogen hydrolase family protein [Defluviitaleaceae bacterium]